GDVGGRRVLVGRTAFAHHVGAHGTVGDLGADVDGAGHPGEGVEVLGHALPVPSHRLAHGGAGDVLDALHEADEPVAVVGGGGGEAHAAVAHDHRRHAVPDRRREERVPRGLAVVVGVRVDEPGRDQQVLGV